MELEGVVHDGVIVPDDATALPEGTRVRITISTVQQATTKTGQASTFAERYAEFRGAATSLPDDLAKQHDHYRLGTPRR
jgi:hypothetical protein